MYATMIRIGLCGFTMSAAQYFRTFPVVEVQQTFYQPPAPQTLAKWRHEAPSAFEFTMKAWQLITHPSTSRTYRRLRMPMTAKERAECGAFRWTAIVQRGWETTRDCAHLLRATAILFQCPASFKPAEENIGNMRTFFGRIERPKGVRFLWEPRGEWPDDIVSRLCADFDLIHTVDPFVRPSLTPSRLYWRLHGIGGSRHVYSDAELQQLVEWLPRAADAYVMFNNMPRIGDAKRFEQLLHQKL